MNSIHSTHLGGVLLCTNHSAKPAKALGLLYGLHYGEANGV